jgi:UDP-N-acetylmuramate--alanine ligase
MNDHKINSAVVELSSLNKNDTVYFIGIGGIGMSALARYFYAKGVTVSGYDKTPTPLTKELEAAGIHIHYEENINLVPKQPVMVVYTPAIPKQHTELQYYQQQGISILKRSDVLQLISKSSFNICIAGTHGKTTITTITAHLLRDSGFGCNAFLGGISANYNTNFWSSEKNVCVIEADEYDRSFLKLNPDVAIISSMDADHLDIYGTANALQDAFVAFSEKLKPGGLLVTKKGLEREKSFSAARHFTYSVAGNGASVFINNLQNKNGSYVFDVHINEVVINEVVLNMGGMHNVENALAAIAVAHELGIEKEKIKSAINSFKGVRRRFEYIIKREELVLIDDYAHHPEELKALIGSVKNLFADKKCIVVFQPHLYSRTNDLAEGFAASLDMADKVILLPIYPARELPMPGVSSELLGRRIKKANVTVQTKEAMLQWMKQNKDDLKNVVLVMAGAGDIDALVPQVKAIIEY